MYFVIVVASGKGKNIAVYCLLYVSFLITANAVNPREPALDALMEHLKTNIANKKSKNVDILFLAQEVGQMLNMNMKTEDKFILSGSLRCSNNKL